LALLYKTKLLNLTGSEELSEKTISIYWGLRNLFRLKEVSAFCLTEGDVIKTFHLPTQLTTWSVA
jgi:hypothetical protein